ncbi:Uncharacterised protein [Salmonella enterica subsp. arizonae]|uniref:Uncharacterized protein n=1 Tax=Salmonella enterica subsp. arizonae TaxID=59203 RepID=A0A379SNT0_SALER|nr:Uncharacterised protein [Salmonella enterica subsp. arizonae]
MAALPSGSPTPLRVTVPIPSPPVERNLTAVVERNAGKNQHAVRGIHVIAAIFTNCGYRLLAFQCAATPRSGIA